MIVPNLRKFKPATPMGTYLCFKSTTDAALLDIDKSTDLLSHDEYADGARVPDVLRRKKKPLPDKLQWPIVATLQTSRLQPITVLWLALRINALPVPILRAWVKEVAEYLVERALTESGRAWDMVDILKQLSETVDLATLAQLARGREIAKLLYVGSRNERQRCIVLALFSLMDEDIRMALINAIGFAVDGCAALRVRDEGTVITALSTRLRRLCAKALEKHPQKELLKREILRTI